MAMRLCFGIGLLCIFAPITEGNVKPKRPNVLFILADDMGWNDIGYHNEAIHTPVLDGLAGAGRKLESAYSLPLCTPSRAALLTGRYPYTIGMQHYVMLPGNDKPMPTDISTIGEELQSRGYATHLVGKWHVGSCSKEGLPTSRGFDSFVGFLLADADHYQRASGFQGKMMYDFWNGTDVHVEDSTTYTQDILEREVIRLIEESKTKDSPFFILHTTPLPHVPLQVKPDSGELYAGVPEPRRAYLRMISHLDESVGRIVKSLEEHKVRDNTVIIFMSDNGGMANGFPAPHGDGFYGNNYPLRGSKASLFEGGVRVPAFINSPLLPPHLVNTPVNQLFHITDWLPTVVSWTGETLTDSATFDGVDQTEVLFGAKSVHPARELIVLQIQDMVCFSRHRHSNSSAALRWKDFKLIAGSAMITDPIDKKYLTENSDYLWTEPDEWAWLKQQSSGLDRITGTECGLSHTDLCLFNIKEDPSETRDISSDHPDLVRHLLELLEREKRRVVEPVLSRQYPVYSYSDVTDTVTVSTLNYPHLKPGYCDPKTPANNKPPSNTPTIKTEL